MLLIVVALTGADVIFFSSFSDKSDTGEYGAVTRKIGDSTLMPKPKKIKEDKSQLQVHVCVDVLLIK